MQTKTTDLRFCVSGLFCALLIAVVWTAGCHQQPAAAPAPGSRVVVLGVDGLDPKLLDKLVAAGQLPNFARLYHEGASGGVGTRADGLPPASPRIWTTFATGQLASIHGLKSFIYKDSEGIARLYSPAQRRVPAAWEIASNAGKRVGVVNWWFTYPAEHVNGFLISDRYLIGWARRAAKFYGGRFERDANLTVYPPRLRTKLDKVPLQAKRYAITAADGEAIDGDLFRLTYAALENNPVDLLMIYTRSLDELSHMRWNTHEPLPGETPGPDQIVEFLHRYDGLLGALLEHLTPRDHLVVLSDHGFERNPTKKGPPGMHHSAATAVGTLILYGPRIAPGIRIQAASLLDVLPTVLELLGLPAARDMPGQVLLRAFRKGQRTLHARVAPYRRSTQHGTHGSAVKADPATLERLRQLGYIE